MGEDLLREIDAAGEHLSALVQDNLEGIRFWQEDIGALVTVREAFPGNDRIHDLIRHLIHMEMREIETLTKEIEQWRMTG